MAVVRRSLVVLGDTEKRAPLPLADKIKVEPNKKPLKVSAFNSSI